MLQRHRFLLEAIAVIVITGIIGVLIAFYSVILGPAETDTAVVINEVYPAYLEDNPKPHQWVELYNRTKEWRTLDGWALDSGQQALLPQIILPPEGYVIIAASPQQFRTDFPNFLGEVVAPADGWPDLNRENDFLALRNTQGRPVDKINWGQAADVPDDVQPLWEAPVAFGGGAPWLLSEGEIAADHSLERRPVGMDRDIPRDFLRQPYPSPGTVNVPSATEPAQRLFIDWTNVASYAGGILLWVAFVYIALIARRFEALTQQRTYWQAMLVAPSGILIYNIVQAYGFLTRGRMTVTEQWWSFVILFVSALGCTALVYIFRQRAQRILEG